MFLLYYMHGNVFVKHHNSILLLVVKCTFSVFMKCTTCMMISVEWSNILMISGYLEIMECLLQNFKRIWGIFSLLFDPFYIIYIYSVRMIAENFISLMRFWNSLQSLDKRCGNYHSSSEGQIGISEIDKKEIYREHII